MDTLPTEILGIVLRWNVELSRNDKNSVVPLRLVCKAFDILLRPYIFKTVQLEFTRFLKDFQNTDSLSRVGHLCGSVYVDVMVVRDEDEISRLTDLFQNLASKVPEMQPLLMDLRRHTLNESTFDETDFRRVLSKVLKRIPNTTRLKLNLPFQVVGDKSIVATLLMASTLACIAKRGEDEEEHAPLKTLVVDHLSDTTVNAICNNPIDLTNAIITFIDLRHLVLTLKRQEKRHLHFNRNLWFLIRKASKLGTLCMIGTNPKRDKTRRHPHRGSESDFRMRSLPYPLDNNAKFDHLQFLELKRVDIDPHQLVRLIEDCSATLKELYLVDVYIKVHSAVDRDKTALWIGLRSCTRPLGACWVAQDLRNMEELHLEVLRVTNLGYDDFDEDQTSSTPNYDLDDPSNLGRSFDQRFVQAAMQPEIDTEPSTASSEAASPEVMMGESFEDYFNHVDALVTTPQDEADLPPISFAESPDPASAEDYIEDYDAEAFQLTHNTTSHFKRCIDGYFTNHNERALKELQDIVAVADRGMLLINQEVTRVRTMATVLTSVPWTIGT
ncbi:hypothetical protein LSUE1_G008699 [Lachnellula suecica]|uniref:F-box domain-containing protein n=1 Tax=Lachnellula suecica TaxID=602035 RepID=A0A8T9BVN6_9HELO|nr:hypothetical protein LSUE1_G008699 [Lachnellula suecica]